MVKRYQIQYFTFSTVAEVWLLKLAWQMATSRVSAIESVESEWPTLFQRDNHSNFNL